MVLGRSFLNMTEIKHPVTRILGTRLFCLILLAQAQSAFAQGSSDSQRELRGSDRPTQRWLPLPRVDQGVDVGKQVELLRLMQNYVRQSDQQRLPKFSEEELRQMERLFENWKDSSGISGLPDLSSIPPEWIDKALQDDALRSQAHKILERYAKDRKVPPPGSASDNFRDTRLPWDTSREGLGSERNRSTRDSQSDSTGSGNARTRDPRQPSRSPRDARPRNGEVGGRDSFSADPSRQRDPFQSNPPEQSELDSDSFENMFDESSRTPNSDPRNAQDTGDSDSLDRLPPENARAGSGIDPRNSPDPSNGTNGSTDQRNATGQRNSDFYQNHAERLRSILGEQPPTTPPNPFRDPFRDPSRQEDLRQRSDNLSVDELRKMQERLRSARNDQGVSPEISENFGEGRNSSQPEAANPFEDPRALEGLGSGSVFEQLGELQRQRNSANPGQEQRSGTRGQVSGSNNLPSEDQLAQLRGLFEQIQRDRQFREELAKQQQQRSMELAERSGAEFRNRSLQNQTQRSFPRQTAPNRDRNSGQLPRRNPQLSRRDLGGADTNRVRPIPRSPSRTEDVARGAPNQGSGADAFDFSVPNGSTNERNSGDSSSAPIDVESLTGKSLEEIGELFAGGASRSARDSNNSASRRSPSSASSSPRSSSQTQNSASNRGSSGSSMASDIASQVERQGFGRALQNIVKNTLKREAGAQKDGRAGADNSDRSGTSPNGNAGDSRQASNAKNSSRDRSSGNRNDRSPSQNSGGQGKQDSDSVFGDIASSFWSAVNEAPPRGGGGGSASSGGSMGSFSPDVSFRFGVEHLITIVVVVLLITLAIFLARRQFSPENVAKRKEERWAKEVMKAGLRTREDVVRAYHHLVLRRAAPAATWWNHHFAKQQLQESSPNLKNVISELTNIYEKARYLPPEHELGDNQMQSVRNALQKFEAAGA